MAAIQLHLLTASWLMRPEKSSQRTTDQALVSSGPSINSALEVIKHQRIIKAQRTHWLAAGGKDGKISLWDIY